MSGKTTELSFKKKNNYKHLNGDKLAKTFAAIVQSQPLFCTFEKKM